MLYLLDTNHCFRLVARDPRILAALDSRSDSRLTTSVVVAGELRYGAMISGRQIENSAAVEDFLAWIDQVGISSETSELYAGLKSRLLIRFGPKDRIRRRGFDLAGLGFNDNDLWIAASAIERGATLVSQDGDFRRMAAIEALPLENWLD